MDYDFEAAVEVCNVVLYTDLYLLGQMGVSKGPIDCESLSRSRVYNRCSLQSPQDKGSSRAECEG